jgi:hypothetical protein
VTTLPARPTVPARPAVYIRGDDSDAEHYLISEVREKLGWPEPAVFADVDADPASRPRSRMAALVEAIAAGQHDGVFAAHPRQLGDDLGQIEAFDRVCRQHGVLLRFSWFHDVTDTRALFDVVREAREFTVTEDHLRLLRQTYVFWDETEFGAPAIDAKRPYGNSNVFGDIAEILDMPESEWSDEDGNPSLDAEWRFLRLHVETAIALQIALITGEFRTGRYVRDDEYDDRSWRRDDT